MPITDRKCFLTGFLTARRLKAGLGGGGAGSGRRANFYQWANACGAPEALQSPEAYAAFAANLPAASQAVTDNGELIWRPTVEDFARYVANTTTIYQHMCYLLYPDFNNNDGYSTASLHEGGNWAYSYSYSSWDSHKASVIMNADKRSWRILSSRAQPSTSVTNAAAGFYGHDSFPYILCPVTGFYYRLETPLVTGTLWKLNGESIDVSYNYPAVPPEFNFAQPSGNYDNDAGRALRMVNALIDFNTGDLTGDNRVYTADLTLTLPVFRIVPSDDGSTNANLRPGNLPGFAVSETNRTFTNPLSGEVYSFESWTYNYQSRTYTLQLPDSAGTLTVTYGNDFLTFAFSDGSAALAAMYPGDGLSVHGNGAVFNKRDFLAGMAAGFAAEGTL